MREDEAPCARLDGDVFSEDIYVPFQFVQLEPGGADTTGNKQTIFLLLQRPDVCPQDLSLPAGSDRNLQAALRWIHGCPHLINQSEF